MVSFTVGADAYDRFMGRYAMLLAPQLADFAAVDAGQRVLDVGCGPGALTAELVRRLGPAAVSAVDPSEPFVAAAQERNPGVEVRRAAAEQLPFRDQAFDAALAQLVVHFMADPVVGLREMARVTRERGVVAACVWDHAGGQGPLSLFWEAAREFDRDVEDESQLAGAREGHLAQLLQAAELYKIEESALFVHVEHRSFEDWWEPFTLGVGPAGACTAALDPKRQRRLRDLCREMLPAAPFVLTARAWAARGSASSSRA
jgi:SAM-dependent methyltransferase